MKYIILLIIIGFSTSCIFDRKNNETAISPYVDSLFDKSTNLTFYLDTSRTIVSAFSKNNKLIWKTDPRKDNNVNEYRIKNPKIVYFTLDSIWFENGSVEVVKVKYNNSQTMGLDKKTGKIDGCSQL